jgi:hypothetical protein
MRLYDSTWKPTYLKNKALLVFVATIFIAMNIVTLVMSALPHNPGQVARSYWPVTAVAVTATAILYWAALRLFQVNNKQGSSLGSKVGFQVHIYEDGDEVPDDMKFPMYEASLDGSRRRLEYKVCSISSIR